MEYVALFSTKIAQNLSQFDVKEFSKECNCLTGV